MTEISIYIQKINIVYFLQIMVSVPHNCNRVLLILLVGIPRCLVFVTHNLLLRTGEYFGVTGVTVYTAGEAKYLSTWGSVLGTIFGTFIAALIAMGIIYFAFVVYRQNW
jgi:hypothetical protein